MAELLWSLQDSQLVARFQRCCGLFPAPDEGPRESSAGPSEGETPAHGVEHLPCANGKGGGGPPNGLRRDAAPQVTAGRCSSGREEGAAARMPWQVRISELRDAGYRVHRARRAKTAQPRQPLCLGRRAYKRKPRQCGVGVGGPAPRMPPPPIAVEGPPGRLTLCGQSLELQRLLADASPH